LPLALGQELQINQTFEIATRTLEKAAVGASFQAHLSEEKAFGVRFHGVGDDSSLMAKRFILEGYVFEVSCNC
jgi:hypothetical protein